MTEESVMLVAETQTKGAGRKPRKHKQAVSKRKPVVTQSTSQEEATDHSTVLIDSQASATTDSASQNLSPSHQQDNSMDEANKSNQAESVDSMIWVCIH